MLSAAKRRHRKITVVPNNMECYTSFTISDATLIDSCQFMLSSLAKLFINLKKGQFRETRKYLESLYVQQPNQLQINIVTEGREEGEAMHICKDYRNHPYQPPTLMPDQQQQIEEENIYEICYTHVQWVFNQFSMTDLREYHNFYLLTYVLSLADMF